MANLIALRGDFEALYLRDLANKAKSAAQARQLFALAAIYDGATCTEAAMIGGVRILTIRDWVAHFNARGLDGLEGELSEVDPGNRTKS